MAITLRVNAERVEALPFSVYRKSGDSPEAQAQLIAHFAVKSEDSTVYLTKDEALAELDQLTMGEVNALVTRLRDAADQVAAPKA